MMSLDILCVLFSLFIIIMQMTFRSFLAQKMDYASPFLLVLTFVSVFLATVCVAMVLVVVRRACLATDPQPSEHDVPPTQLGSVVDVRQPTELFPQTQHEQAVMSQNWVTHQGVTAEAEGLKRVGSSGRGYPSASVRSCSHAPWRRSNRFVTFRITHAAGGDPIFVEMKTWRTIFMLLLIVQHETRIPVVDLCYHGQQLQENWTLHQCGFVNGDFIELHLFPRSGLVSL